MKKIIIILSVIISILCINKVPNNEKDTIRFRIIANSNSNEDQQLKQEILKNIRTKIINNNINNIEEERKFINNSIPSLEKEIKKSTNNFNINYGNNFFPEKEYNGKKYSEGYYESLVITLGEGTGDNFWCFLFPPLCMIEKEDVEYKSIIKEKINQFIK